MKLMRHQVLLFYKYVTLENPVEVADWVRSRATELQFKGRVLVAQEGINGTLEGLTEDTEMFAREILVRDPFVTMSVKRSEGTGNVFPKLSVKVRDEIVGTRFPKEVDPLIETGKRLSASELRAWYQSAEEFTVIDMRNNYEFQSGHFKNSINPGLESSRDLPQVMPELAPYKSKKVVTVCTGGVRCEKMSAYLLKEGFENVYQLEDGMHGYMEQFPATDFLGTLYTFDQRLTMDFNTPHEIIGKCYKCDSKTEQYVNCANLVCHLHFLVCSACTQVSGTYCSLDCSQQK